MKKRLLQSFALVVGLSVAAGAVQSEQAYAQSTIPVILDGKTLSFDVPPCIVNNRVLVPVRVIFEALGAKVTWDAASRTVYSSKGNVTLKIPIGSLTAYKNGTAIHLDSSATIIQGRTLVPIRFVSEAFGEQVSWVNQTVIIKTPATTSSTSGGSGQTSTGQTTGSTIQVVAGDTAVTQDQLNHVQAVLQGANIVAGLQNDLGRSFRAPVTIHITKDVNGYRAALSQRGISDSDVSSIADGSNGVAIGEDVYFPLSENSSDDQLRNILGHELTHVLLNETGIGDLTPSWVNEGIAWKEGLKFQYASKPNLVYQGQIDYMRETILDAYGTSNWQGLLTDSEDTIHSTDAYNVEWQDYFAVDLLQQTYGWNAVLNYLNALPSNSADQAFKNTFGVTPSSFESTFNQTLSASKQKADKGMEIKLKVSSSFQGILGIMPKNSNVWSTYRVTPGTYDIRILPNGTITGLPGAVQQQPTDDPVDANTVFVGIMPDAPQNENGTMMDHAGFALVTKYGQDYYLDSWVVDTKDQSQYDDYLSHLGIELLDVEPIQ